MEEAIETELRMSRIQHAGEADAVPRAVPMCAGLEHQHVQFYHRRMSWFLDPYQAIDQGWLLIMKSSTAQKLQWVNPPPMRVWAELNQPPKDFSSEQISRWSKPGPSSKLLQPGHVTLDQSKALTRQTVPSKIMVFSCPYFGARAGPLESSVTPAAWPHCCCSPPPTPFLHLLQVQIHSTAVAGLVCLYCCLVFGAMATHTRRSPILKKHRSRRSEASTTCKPRDHEQTRFRR